jgi:hypothetical protein
MCDYDNYFYLHVTHDEDIGKSISILTAEIRNMNIRLVFFLPIIYLPLAERARGESLPRQTLCYYYIITQFSHQER